MRISAVSCSTSIIIIAATGSSIIESSLERCAFSNDVPLLVTFEAHLLLSTIFHYAPMSSNTKASRNIGRDLHEDIVLSRVYVFVHHRFYNFNASAIWGKCPSDGFVRDSV